MVKPIFFVSLAANVLLLGALVYVRWAAPQHPPQREIQRPPAEAVPLCPQPTPAPARFQWSQIESSDYPTYIANLRGIGCPESTIRDIISADVENLYAQKRWELQARGLGALDLAREMEALRQQQGELLVRLLGVQSISGDAPKATASSSSAKEAVEVSPAQQPPPVVLPVALLTPDPSLKLTSAQKEDWESLTKEFVEAIGGPNQDPNNPEYLRRWNKARVLFDAQFKIRFGEEIYLKVSTDLPVPGQ